jgi:DNA-binding MarR family transcriptional regulator
MDTTPATASRAVDTLEALGFVSRRADPSDGRGVIVAVRARGQRWSDRRGAVLREALAQLPDGAAPDRLVKDLAKLNSCLRSVSGTHHASGLALLAR